MTIITTGDYSKIPVTLKRDSSTFTISDSAVIKAVLTDLDRSTVISPEVTINNSATGSDLANSKFIVEFTKSETLAITKTGEAYLEVQVEDTIDEPETWTSELLVRQGNIS